MTYTPIAKGTQNWDVPLNAALAQLDANITTSSGTALQASNNLSDLTNVPQARANLNLTGLANALSNMTATTNPTVNSDNTQGYSIGSTWFNTLTSAMYVASNVSTGAAVWLQIPPSYVDLTSVQFIGGNKTFTGATAFSNAGVSSPVITATATSNSAVAIRIINNQAADVALSARVNGDTLSRLIIGADGKLNWSPGSGASPDVNLYRLNSTSLQTDDSLVVAGNMTVNGNIISNTTSATGTGVFTIAANWTLTTAEARTWGNLVTLYLEAAFTGTTVTSGASGNITDQTVGTFAAAYRPNQLLTTTFNKGGVADGAAHVSSGGVVTLTSLSPTATIASGDFVRMFWTFVS